MTSKLVATAAALSLSFLACATEDIDTPPIEDDLVQSSAGGKSDTGYLSDLAAELEGVFSATVVVDVRALSVAERTAELERLQGDNWAVRRLIDAQIKFSKNQINASSLHLNLSSSDATITEIILDEAGFIRISYQCTVETIVSNEELEEEGTTLQQILDSTFTAVVPDDPSRMASDVGAACLDPEHADASAYNYFYYYLPEREGCAEAMTTAKIGRQTASLEVRNLAPNKTIFPEYDQLVADNKINVVAFFGAAEHDWEPGAWDWGTYQRDQFVRDLRNRGFAKQEVAEGELYRKTVGDLVENVTIIGPETLKLLSDDADGLFQRQVSSNEIIFYNGHSFYGSLSVLQDADLYPGSYQIFFMNSCWSYEYYTKQIFQNNVTPEDPEGWLNADVVNDTESGWFHNQATLSRILLSNLLRGAETGGIEGDRYYTWDRIIGAMNKHAVDNQGSNKSHEIYGVSGVRTNRYDPTSPVEPEPGATRFSSDSEREIPDNDATGVSDTITVPAGTGPVGALTIDVNIEHPYVGDLTVTLHHGDRYFTLHSRDGGSTDDLAIHTTTDHFAGMDSAGDWTLTITDSANYDAGKLTGWAIEL